MTKPKNAPPVKSLPNIKTPGAWPKAVAPINNSTAFGRYDGRELRPFTGRPGSLDALACPSRTGTRRVYRGDAL